MSTADRASFEAVGVSPASLDDCDPSQECHYCSCREFQLRRCRDCFCFSDDHNNDEAGGGCTSCGDCEGWL